MIKINESHVTVMVGNMDKAISFYESIGLTMKNRWDDHYAMLQAPGITLGIHPSDGIERSSGTLSIGFTVDDISDAKALLQGASIAMQSQDDGKSGLYLHFTDLDGTQLYFVQPKWG